MTDPKALGWRRMEDYPWDMIKDLGTFDIPEVLIADCSTDAWRIMTARPFSSQHMTFITDDGDDFIPAYWRPIEVPDLDSLDGPEALASLQRYADRAAFFADEQNRWREDPVEKSWRKLELNTRSEASWNEKLVKKVDPRIIQSRTRSQASEH